MIFLISSHLISSHLALVIARVMGAEMLPRLRYSWISRFLALLLLAAAGLKLTGLAVDPVGRMGLFSMPAFQIAVVEFEFFLAAWLLWGKRPLGSWATALGVFTIFAVVSAYQGWIGRTSCGCFGRLSVSPWYAFGIDLAVLLALILGRPDLREVRQPRQFLASFQPVLYGLGGAILVLGSLAGVGSLIYGSADAALAHIRGERISLYPRLVDVGTGDPSETRDAAFEIVNREDHSIRLIGGAHD
jgi:hypothetical protein